MIDEDKYLSTKPNVQLVIMESARERKLERVLRDL
jgi:hypothetical protein